MFYTKYREMGLSLMPLIKNEKKPLLNGWQQYSDRLPTEEETLEWDVKFRSNNVGLVLGVSSGVVGLDIDTGKKDIHDICPPSPLVKCGNFPKETRFFRAGPGLESKDIYIDRETKEQVQILWTGRQTVMPPSVHPDTHKPYFWLSHDTFESIPVSDLPVLTLEQIEKIRDYVSITYRENLATESVELRGVFVNDDPSRNYPHGSQARLKALSAALVTQRKPLDEAIKSLLDYDREHHKPCGYFSDPSGKVSDQRNGSPYMNAFCFYTNVFESINKKRIQKGLLPETPEVEKIEIINVNTKSGKFIRRELPRPSGILRDIVELTNDYSEREIKPIALGGAISVLSAVACNRFRYKDVWPNMYSMIIAPTGGGKSFPFRIAKRLLMDAIQSDLVTSAGAQSVGALTKNLVSRQERLELVDEISSMFLKIRDGGVFQNEIQEAMCSLWSDSSSIYLAPSYSEREDTSTCYNACVNLFGATTPTGFKESVDRTMFSKGLIPRFIFYVQHEYGQIKDGSFNEDLFNHVSKDLNKIYSIEKQIVKGPGTDQKRGNRYCPIDIKPTEPAAQLEEKNLSITFSKIVEMPEVDEIQKQMYTRAKEHVMKLSTIHCLSNGRNFVNLDDLAWGKELFESSLHNATIILDAAGSSSQWERDLTRVIEILKSDGHITQRNLSRATKFPVDRLKKVLEHLTASELIRIGEIKGKHGPATKAIQWIGNTEGAPLSSSPQKTPTQIE